MHSSLRAVDARWQLDIDIGEVDVTAHGDRLDNTAPGPPRFVLRVATFADAVAAIRGVDQSLSEAEIRARIVARTSGMIEAALR